MVGRLFYVGQLRPLSITRTLVSVGVRRLDSGLLVADVVEGIFCHNLALPEHLRRLFVVFIQPSPATAQGQQRRLGAVGDV